MQKRCLAIGLIVAPWALYSATVQVHVTDHQGTPVNGAEVKLVNSQSGQTASKISTDTGQVEFDQLVAGTYQFKAALPKHVSSEPDPVNVSDSDVVVKIVVAPQEVVKKIVEEANEAFKKKKFQDAAGQYAKALQFFPRDASMWAHLAKSQEMSNEMDKAMESVKQAVRYGPNQFAALEKEIVGSGAYQAGKKYLLQKQFAKAVESFTLSIKADPTYAPAFYGLGMSYANQQMYPQAFENVQQALKLDPSNAEYKGIEERLQKVLASGSSK
jgi:tetratricopeptide (TPR) repeat protein